MKYFVKNPFYVNETFVDRGAHASDAVMEEIHETKVLDQLIDGGCLVAEPESEGELEDPVSEEEPSEPEADGESLTEEPEAPKSKKEKKPKKAAQE